MKQQRTESVPGDKVGAAAGPLGGASPWKSPVGTITAMKKGGTTLPPLDTLTLFEFEGFWYCMCILYLAA